MAVVAQVRSAGRRGSTCWPAVASRSSRGLMMVVATQVEDAGWWPSKQGVGESQRHSLSRPRRKTRRDRSEAARGWSGWCACQIADTPRPSSPLPPSRFALFLPPPLLPPLLLLFPSGKLLELTMRLGDVCYPRSRVKGGKGVKWRRGECRLADLSRVRGRNAEPARRGIQGRARARTNCTPWTKRSSRSANHSSVRRSEPSFSLHRSVGPRPMLPFERRNAAWSCYPLSASKSGAFFFFFGRHVTARENWSFTALSPRHRKASRNHPHHLQASSYVI